MRWHSFGALGLVSMAMACGVKPGDPAGSAEGGTGGSGGAGGAGGSAGASYEANEPTGQLDQSGEENDPKRPTAPSQNLVDSCALWTQQSVTVNAVIAGANASGSAAAAREALRTLPSAQSPVPVHLRTQDFLNYYGPNFAEPPNGVPSVHVQLHPAVLPGQYSLLVAIRAPALTTRPQTSLTIVLDNTQSLDTSGLTKAQSALLALADELSPGDTVQLTTADSDGQFQKFAIETSLDALKTAITEIGLAPERPLSSMLGGAYVTARESYVSGGSNRVLLVSDGADDPATLVAQEISAAAEPGPTGDIRLVALGTGPARDNGHRLLRTASRLGRGAYRYLDSETEATALGGHFDELFGVGLDDVKLGLTLPWYFTVQRPFIADTTSTGTAEPQYLAPGRTMSFLFRLEACSESVAPTGGGTIDASLSWLSPTDGSLQTSSASVAMTDLFNAQGAPELEKAFAVLSYAEALRSLDKRRLETALNQVQAAGTDAELAEIATLIPLHPVFAQVQ